MGYYIDPDDMPKEQFLEMHGRKVSKDDILTFDFRDKEYIPVVLMDNGPFTAAGVAYCPGEVQEFTRQKDHRRKTYYILPRSVLGKSVGLDPADVQSW